MRICLVIPCYNEESRFNLKEIETFAASSKSFHLFFVNDGSSDGTLEMLRKLSKEYDNIDHLNLSNNLGKAEAVRNGFINSKKLGKFDFIGFWDADLATPFTELVSFKTQMETGKYDIVMGSRVLRLGGAIQRKWYRHYLGRIFATFASISLDLPVYDTQCGAKFFKSSLRVL